MSLEWDETEVKPAAVRLSFPHMKLRDRLVARRRKRAHERHLRERERQEALQGRAQEAVRDVARGPAGTGPPPL